MYYYIPEWIQKEEGKMTERKIHRNIKKTAGEIELWAEETEQLIEEISSFLGDMKKEGNDEEENESRQLNNAAEETLRKVADNLEEIKQAMTGLRETENL